MCILLVEDEWIIREVFMEMLMSKGFSVCEAETSDQAVGLIEYPSEEFSLLITDVDLPGKWNGFDIAKLMRRRHPLFPVIYITGGFVNVRPLALKEMLLLKPFRFQKLLMTVQELLEGRQHASLSHAV